MFLWVGNLAAAVAIATSGAEGDLQLQKHEAKAWGLIKPSVVVLLREGIPSGQAALIDKSGLFLAHQSAIFTSPMKAKLSDGRIVILDWKSTDTPTQTVLLQAENWPAGQGDVVEIHQEPLSDKPMAVIVVLPTGPVKGELVSNTLGILNNQSRRMFALGEVHFEMTAQSVAGAPVFDDAGKLLGLLNSTLESKQDLRTVRVAAPNSIGLGNALARGNEMRGWGPGDQTVGYVVGTDVLKRVVSGFLSPSHQVRHPAIGLYCKDAPVPGALVGFVKAGSPAEKAGFMLGDVIVKMDDTPIEGNLDFARYIESKDIGDTIKVVVARNFDKKTLSVTVGVYQN